MITIKYIRELNSQILAVVASQHTCKLLQHLRIKAFFRTAHGWTWNKKNFVTHEDVKVRLAVCFEAKLLTVMNVKGAPVVTFLYKMPTDFSQRPLKTRGRDIALPSPLYATI